MSAPNNPFSKPAAQPAATPPPPSAQPTLDMVAATAKAVEVFGDSLVFDEGGCGRSFDDITAMASQPGTAEYLVAEGGDVFASLDVTTDAGRAMAIESMHRAAVQILEGKKAQAAQAAQAAIQALADQSEAELKPMSDFIADYRQRAGI
jgi:hypothetical protein